MHVRMCVLHMYERFRRRGGVVTPPPTATQVPNCYTPALSILLQTAPEHPKTLGTRTSCFSIEPLPEMMGKVDKATKKLEDSRDVVEQKLQECKAIDANRCYYLQLLKTTVMEDKITDWFDSCPDAGDAQSDLDNFRRIAIECKQLQEDEARSISTCCEQEEEKQAMLQRTQALRDKYAWTKRGGLIVGLCWRNRESEK